jgi:hypothetical protein
MQTLHPLQLTGKVLKLGISSDHSPKKLSILPQASKHNPINQELPRLKYNIAGKKGRDFDENGKLKTEIAHLILTHPMASRPDFAVEKLDFEHLADELGCEVRFTAKYHCKITGEGVENGWGFSKKIYHGLPIAKKRYLDVFTKSVKNCLIQVTPERARGR